MADDLNPIKVYIVGLKTLEARFDRLHHVLAVIACRIRVRAPEQRWYILWPPHALAMSFDELAKE